MIYNNEYQPNLSEPVYDKSVGGKIAKVPGMDKYPYPEDGNPGKTNNFPADLTTTISRFNPLFRFNVNDSILSNVDFAKVNTMDYQPTIANLLKPENVNDPGLRYSLADFMHCKDAPIVSGYHMITLRRFAYPIEDNLRTAKAAADHNTPAMDVGRLVTYSTAEKNKLSEIMTMSFGLNWKELTADFWTPEIIGNESGASGLLGTMMEFANPMYMTQKGLGRNAVNVDPHYDQNRTYGPVDSITKTHIRDRGLNFNHEINLTFEYDLMSYDSVNPKAAMIDLLSNMLVVTFNDGKFWGGAIKWRGMPRGAHSRYLSTTDAFKASSDFNSTVDYYKKQLTSLAGGANGWQAVLNLGKLLLKGLEGMALDKLVSSLGRPTVAVANSLLSGEPVGMSISSRAVLFITIVQPLTQLHIQRNGNVRNTSGRRPEERQKES